MAKDEVPEAWTVAEACEEFARQGMPVDEGRFTMAVRAVRLKRAGEGPSGPSGGRGQALYPIGELQRLHSALAPWMVDRSRQVV